MIDVNVASIEQLEVIQHTDVVLRRLFLLQRRNGDGLDLLAEYPADLL